MQVNKVIILVANISLSHHSKSPEMQFSLTPKFRFSYAKPLTPPSERGVSPPHTYPYSQLCHVKDVTFNLIRCCLPFFLLLQVIWRTLVVVSCKECYMYITMRTPNHIGSVVLFICLMCLSLTKEKRKRSCNVVIIQFTWWSLHMLYFNTCTFFTWLPWHLTGMIAKL